MILKKIKVDGQEITFGASADTPRRFRIEFGKDLFKEMSGEVSPGTMEELAFTMMKQANPAAECTIDEWLDGFSGMGLYTALPEIIGLWTGNTAKASTAKKK